MSYRIEYQWAVFRVAGAPLGLAEDRYIVAIEGGDNNLYDTHTNKRSRSWEACMVGTFAQTLRQAVYFAGACEGGGLKPHGRDCSPESYIRRIRRLLEDAGASPARGHWRPRLCVAPVHPAVAELRQLGMEPREERRYGTNYAVIDVPPKHLGAYFQVIDRHQEALHTWCWIEVYGLPDS
jgi:hypothetical protein